MAIKNRLTLIFVVLASWTSAQPFVAVEEKPAIIYAKPESSDPWYPYTVRPTKQQAIALNKYSDEMLAKIPSLNQTNPNIMPWSFAGIASGDKQLFSLQSIIPDKYVDPQTKEVYSIMYHGTTSDLTDVFAQGREAIRFDVATHTVLGMGFYLSASMNEAKSYACERLKERRKNDPNLRAIVVVMGVKDLDVIKGKTSPAAQLSDQKTGDPLDTDIYFKRNADPTVANNRYNQFSFFSNVRPHLRTLYIVNLPPGFGRAEWVQDYDGRPSTQGTQVCQ